MDFGPWALNLSHALHLDVFEQPEQQVFFSNLLGHEPVYPIPQIQGLIKIRQTAQSDV
jgi:hypothetical protein